MSKTAKQLAEVLIAYSKDNMVILTGNDMDYIDNIASYMYEDHAWERIGDNEVCIPLPEETDNHSMIDYISKITNVSYKLGVTQDGDNVEEDTVIPNTNEMLSVWVSSSSVGVLIVCVADKFDL